MLRFTACALTALMLGGTSAALAQQNCPPNPFEGSPEEQAACRPDAIRFCKHLLSTCDNFQILACLQQNRSKISQRCNRVLQSHGQ